jgi:hypothetical protein
MPAASPRINAVSLRRHPATGRHLPSFGMRADQAPGPPTPTRPVPVLGALMRACNESAANATRWMEETCTRNRLRPGALEIHSERRTPLPYDMAGCSSSGGIRSTEVRPAPWDRRGPAKRPGYGRSFPSGFSEPSGGSDHGAAHLATIGAGKSPADRWSARDTLAQSA